MDVKVPILAALIGAIGGLVGGGVTTAADYYFGLEASRQERLQEARRNAYVQWLEVRTLSGQVDELKAMEKHVEAKKLERMKLERKFDSKGREVMGKIATYGGQNVVESVARWYRADGKLRPCTYSSLQNKKVLTTEIKAHQAMRGDLMPDEELVSDADMAALLLQCDMPPVFEEVKAVPEELEARRGR